VLAGDPDEAPTQILAVSVVDLWTERLESAASEVGLPLVVVAASHIPISTALPRPEQAGPDRLLAAWAAATLHGRPVIVVDLGTATTVDAVGADGSFLGGAILPGLRLAADALAEGTARLPRVDLDLPADAIGEDTEAAIQSGVVIGHIGAVRELVTRMRDHLGPKPDAVGPHPSVSEGQPVPTVVVTGGLAAASWAGRAWRESAGPTLPAITNVLDPELVLRGLGLLAAHMSPRPSARVAR
jgi:pantothenate kinase type III